jgi:RNA polymerase sigma-70 factor, ECF subfamily
MCRPFLRAISVSLFNKVCLSCSTGWASDAGAGCVGKGMSSYPAAVSGWMEIPATSVRRQSVRAEGDLSPEVDAAGSGTGAGVAERASDLAVAELVDAYAGTLYRVAYSVLRNTADAEDAVQEAYLRVLRHRDSLSEIRDARVWLVRIVWNVVLDRKRRAKARPETDDIADAARMLPAAGLTAEERAVSAQRHEQVLRAVMQLPEKEQRVLVLSAFEELSSVEIAQVLGTTESTVRSRLFRARNMLSALLSHNRQGDERSAR